ncbi:MAG TPA: hydroxysqualene dehydroxylase HpnE [Vicinamibacteria bacterium]|nr:hydroxysqualene dehydroxylase HpnE [Vicinamibacteria bacterium]
MKVVVVGAGFAGFAAAVRLQERRHQVVLLERRGVLGGRATSSRDSVTGEDVDNGTHLMVGAYRATLDLVRRASASDLLRDQPDLRLDWVDERGTTALACPALPAPLHLVVGLLGLRVPLLVKLQAIRFGLSVRFGPRPEGLTLAEHFARCGQGEQARRLLWDPLALAILNEVPERSAAVLFHRVYQEAFLVDRRASRLVFLRRGWGALLERIAAYFEGRGGRVVRGARALGLELQQCRVVGVLCQRRPEAREAIAAGVPGTVAVEPADAVVSAVPPHALTPLLPEAWLERPPFDALEHFGSAPIVSVEMWLDRPVVDRVMVGLRDSEVEWVFDKGRLFGRSGAPQHLAFIVSAAYRSASKTNAELVAAAESALRRYFPPMREARVERALVLRDPTATFSSTPELETLRPGPITPIGGLFLAGDWTATGLPATIEGAVRSGLAAAEAIDRGRR